MAATEDTNSLEKAENTLMEKSTDDAEEMTEPQHKKVKRNHKKDMIDKEEDVNIDGKETKLSGKEPKLSGKEKDVDVAGEEEEEEEEEPEVYDEEDEIDMVGEEEEVDYTDEDGEVDMVGQEEGMTDEDDIDSTGMEEEIDKDSQEENEDITLQEDDDEEAETAEHEEQLNKTGQEEKAAVDVDVSDISKDSKLEKDARSSVQQEDMHTTSDICTEEMEIKDQVGTVFQSHRYDPILIYFQHHGKTEIAEASGCLYINGSHSLFTVCKNEKMMKSLVNVDDTVHFDAVCKKQEIFFSKSLQRMGRKSYFKTTWIVQLMWKGPKPDVSLLNTEHKFDEQDAYIDALIKQVELQQKEDDELDKKKKDCKRMTGKVEEIISDTHGVMKTDKENKIIFKREDFICDGMKLREGQILKDELQIGASAVALVKEEELEYESVTYSFQAISIWKLDKPSKVQRVEVDVPACWFLVPVQPLNKRLRHDSTFEKDQVGVVKEIHRPKGGVITLESGKEVWFHRRHLSINKKKLGFTDILEEAVKVGDTVHCDIVSNEGQKYVSVEVSHVADLVWKNEKPSEEKVGDVLRARVLKLDKPQATGVESGLLKIQDKGRYQGKKVAFDRKHTYFYGLSLEKADLAYLMQEAYSLYCTIEALPENEGGTVTHKATAAWYGTHHGPEITEETLISQDAGVKHLRNAGLDIDTFENLISGKLEPLHEKPLEHLPLGYVSAHMVYLDPPEKDKGVVHAYFVLENGKPGQKVKLSRNSLKVWGFSMKNADLGYVFNPDDRIICWVWWMRSEKVDSYRIKYAWIGNQTYKSDSQNMETLEKDTEFNAWLNRHNLDMEKFRLLVDGKLMPLQRVDTHSPFRGDQKMERGLYMNPMTMCKVQLHNIVDALLNSNSLDDQALQHIIQDKDTAQMAEFVSQGLAVLLQNYREDQVRKMERIRSPRRSPMYDRSGGSAKAGHRDNINKGGYGTNFDRSGYHDSGDRARNRDNIGRARNRDEDRVYDRKEDKKLQNRNRERMRNHDNRIRVGRGDGKLRPDGRERPHYSGGDRADYRRARKSDVGNRPGYRNREDRKRMWRPETRYEDEPYHKWSRMDDTRDIYKSRREQRQNRSSASESESADYY